MHSFNIAYRGDWPFDEPHFARQAAERAGTTHHQVEYDPAASPTCWRTPSGTWASRTPTPSP